MITEELNRYDLKRSISFPERDEHLAEFMGILTGDGFMNQYNYPKRIVTVIEITGNGKKDMDYMKYHVLTLIKRLFNLNANLYFREEQNTARVIINSKAIFSFIGNNEFPKGNKEQITPPIWIMKNDLFFRRFIRGIFDTDGNLCLKNKEGKKYPVIGLSSKSKPLLVAIQEFLKLYEISSYLGTRVKNKPEYKKIVIDHKLEINGKRNISLFFDNIGSNNPRNKIKHKEIEF